MKNSSVRSVGVMTLSSTKNHIYEKVDIPGKTGVPVNRAGVSGRHMVCLNCGAAFDKTPAGVLHATRFCSSWCEKRFGLEIIQAHVLAGGKR